LWRWQSEAYYLENFLRLLRFNARRLREAGEFISMKKIKENQVPEAKTPGKFDADFKRQRSHCR
jgi:hypothetical protein